MYQIRTYNAIAERGLNRLQPADFQVGADVERPQGIILRSHKLHNETVPDSVLAVARAGAGVNNIPVADYTRRGIVVFNTPGANANAVKELVIAGLLLSSRGILQGRAYVESLGHITDSAEMSALLEQQKKQFAGSEIAGKCLGVVGLGAIGSLIANAALDLGMDVVGYDPALSVEAAWRLSSRVRRMESLSALLAEVDYLTLHVPAIDATRGLINADTLKLMRPSAAIMNFARDAIVDTSAVLSALDNGRLRQYVCDFPEPLLIGHEKVLALPHIGASTAEAEENCAVMAVDQLKDYLLNGNILNSVNFPTTSMPRTAGACRITFTNDNVSGVLGQVLTLLAEKSVNVIDMVNKSRNEVAYNILDLAVRPSDELISAICAVEHLMGLRVICEE